MSSINDQASDSDSDHGHGQSSETSGKTKPVQAKVPTSKGQEYICNRLRDKLTRVYQLSQGNELKLHGL